MTAHVAVNTATRNATYLLIAITCIFLLRSLWTYPIEHSDAIQKYFYAAEILRSGDWSILLTNHHTLRWAAILPQTGLTWLLGNRYEVFFILPLLMFSAYVVLIVFSLRNVLNVSQQLLLWAFLFFESTWSPVMKTSRFRIPDEGGKVYLEISLVSRPIEYSPVLPPINNFPARVSTIL